MTYSVPPVCPRCKGSRKIVVILPDDGDPRYKMPPGYDFISPRPICPVCMGEGSLEHEPSGEYPPCPIDHPPNKTAFEFSPDQQSAIDEILAWMATDEKRKSLGGFAGTGKTTIISKLLQLLKRHSLSVCAPTGKAAAVLRNKGVHASTLHKLIYSPSPYCTIHGVQSGTLSKDRRSKRCTECGRPLLMRWIRVPLIDADLVIVDESSMLNQDMVDDVESLARKILYVGDHGQLEPIGKDPGIMRAPQIRLEQIHRQAAQSGIIRLAHHMRQGSHPTRWNPEGAEDARVVEISKLVPRNLSRFDVILCGYNKTRKSVNAAIRKFRGFRDELPEVGERIICLQNDSDLGVYNGQLVTVTYRHRSYEYPKYDLIDEVGNEYFEVPVHPDQFKEEKKMEMWSKGIGLFDFGYCLTTHKSQGSEWDNVAVIEQLARSWDPARWRYTAATRAAKRLEYWIPIGGI